MTYGYHQTYGTRSHKPITPSFWTFTPILFFVGMRFASGETANVNYLLVGFYALMGRRQAIHALLLSWLFTMINPGIAPEASGASAGRYAVLLGAAASALIQSEVISKNPRINNFTLATMMLGLGIVFHSFLFSPIVDVSVLKALSWTMAATTSVSLWSGMTVSERATAARDVFWGLTVLLIVSLPLIVLPVGYLRNGTGFQGLLNHPQVFGPTMALLGAWCASRIFAERQPSWILLALFGASLAVVMLTQARTAGVASVVAVGLAMGLVPVLSGQRVGRVFPGLRSARVWGTILAAIVTATLIAPLLTAGLDAFIRKGGTGGGFLDSYNESRSVLIDPMIANIAEHPWTGIGFGIASDYSTMEVDRDSILGLPTGANIEKGVAFLAVIEELGIFGAFLVGAWLWALMRGCIRGGLSSFTVCLTVVLLNFGESTFFSPGGMGMLPLVLITWAYASGRGRSSA